MNSREAYKILLPWIQAWVEGKKLQYRSKGYTLWTDWSDDFYFDPPNANEYDFRIKPEPREIWVNEYPLGFSHEWFTSADHAKARTSIAISAGGGVRQVKFREVLEDE